MISHSTEIDQLSAALVKAQGEMEPAVKDATNPHYRSKYADLAAIWKAARVPLARHGLAVLQGPTLDDRGVSVVTRLLHTSGQWMEFDPLTIPLAKPDAHGVGSATSYAKRYALAAVLGIVAEEDDDGNGAVGQPPAETARPKPQPAPKGYADWLADLEAVVPEGSEALKAAWTKSSPEFRRHMMATANAKWERMKADAAKVQTAVPA